MTGAKWQAELSMMLWRYSGMGIGVDIGSMSLVELWGVYCVLKRLTAG